MYFVADFGLAGQIHRRSGDGMPSPGGSTDGFPPVGHRRRPSKAHTNVIMTNVRGNPQASFWVNRRDRHELSRCRASGRFDPAQSPYMRRVRRGGANPAAHRLPAARVLTAARHPLATRHGDWNHYRGRPRRATNRGDRPGQTPAARRGGRRTDRQLLATRAASLDRGRDAECWRSRSRPRAPSRDTRCESCPCTTERRHPPAEGRDGI